MTADLRIIGFGRAAIKVKESQGAVTEMLGFDGAVPSAAKALKIL